MGLLGSVLMVIASFYMMVVSNALFDAAKLSKKEFYLGHLKLLLAALVAAIGVLMMFHH